MFDTAISFDGSIQHQTQSDLWDGTQNYYLRESPYENENLSPLDQLTHASSIRVMHYLMPNVMAKRVEASALLMVPKQTRPVDGWRVVVWAHGSIGVADNCAPSRSPIHARVKHMCEELLEQGYVILAVDYEGLGGQGMHPFLHVKSEANSAIYAMQALKQAYAHRIHGDWMSAGQSQGGQAAIGIAEYANQDHHFKGSVAGGPASNLGFIMSKLAPETLSYIEKQEQKAGIAIARRQSIYAYATLLTFVAYAGPGITAYEPDFEYSYLFQPESRALAAMAIDSEHGPGLSMNLLRDVFKAEIEKFLQADSSRKLMQFPGVDNEFLLNHPVMVAFLKQHSQPGRHPISKPLLIIQGEADISVPYEVTKGLFLKIKASNPLNPCLEMISVPDAGHTQAIIQRQADLMQFIKTHMPSA